MIQNTKKQNRLLLFRGAIYLFLVLVIGGCDTEKQRLFDKKTQQEMSPAQVLQDLKAGNVRFRSNIPLNRGALQELGIQASKVGQFPKAVILACMDSRSIPEIIFDQSIGDIFTLRVAGNVVNNDMLASMEYATKYAGAKLIVIMGHTQCGAVEAACEDIQGGNLSYVINAIQPAVDKKDRVCNDASVITNIALRNVQNMMQRVLQKSPIIRDMIARREIAMVGALHDLKSGIVHFEFMEGLAKSLSENSAILKSLKEQAI